MAALFNKVFNYEYLKKYQLNGLDKYKYSAVDNSPVSLYLMHPFWNQLVKLYPMWLAPNILTFVGFLCLVINFLTFSVYDFHFYGLCPDVSNCTKEAQLNSYKLFQQETNYDYSRLSLYLCSCIPSYLWLLSGVAQFLGHHLDGTDGKQARRTKTSSALGELFDHGLDSWTSFFLPVAFYSIVGRNAYGLSAIDMYYINWAIWLTFIVSHWEKYNTGVLFLPWSYDISQIFLTIASIVTYFYGQSIWYQDLRPHVNLTLADGMKYAIYIGAICFSVPFTLYNILKGYRKSELLQSSFYEGMRPLFGVFYMFAAITFWTSNSRINILEAQPRALFWFAGTLFSNIACRLIIAQMTKTRCEIFNWILIPLTIIVALVKFTNLQPLYEVYFLYFMAVLVTLAHIHYGICVVRQICRYLKIYCFIITRKPSQD